MVPRTPRSDSGFALIEVIVSAAVLALVALAVLSGIDGATASTAREKARAVASALAEADQERLRQMPVTTLAQYADSATHVIPADAAPGATTVDGVSYAVVSKAQWVRDDNGAEPSCTDDGRGADYIHISSTATSNVVGARIPAVTIDSLTAPNVAFSSTKGTLAVKVIDAGKAPVQGITVSLAGAAVPTPQTTNEVGCAVFQWIATGTYSATLNRIGEVDRDGNAISVKANIDVSPGKLALVTMPYDDAARVDASVVTYAPGSTPPSTGPQIASSATQVSAVNGDYSGLLRTWPAAATGTTPADKLFPFPGQYTFFTGTCHYNDPTDSARYTTLNTAAPNGTLLAGQMVQAVPGAPKPANVVQPPLNVQIAKNAAGKPPTKAMSVVAIPVNPPGDACLQPKAALTTIQVAGKWYVARSGTSLATLDAGVPFGLYRFCFKDGTQSFTTSTDYDNTTPPTGAKDATVYSPAAWPGSSCPAVP